MKSFSPADGDKAMPSSSTSSNNATSPSSLQGSLTSMLKSLSVMDIATICIVNDNAQLPSNELLMKISLEHAATGRGGGGERFRRRPRQCKRSPTSRRRRSSSSNRSKTTNKATPVVQEEEDVDDDSDYLDSSTEKLASVFKEMEENDFDLSIEELDPFMEVERWGESPRVSSSGRKGHREHQQRFSDHQDTSLVYPHRRISYPEEESPILPKRSLLLLPPPPPPPPSTSSNEEASPPIHSPTSVIDISVKAPL